MVFLHGAFGAGRNWLSVARRLVAARPEWGGILVDLRLHGGSRELAPPHTIRASAADIGALVAALARPVAAVLGHSLGGKVALRYAHDYPGGLRQAWVIDCSPSAGAPGGEAWEMLRAVRRMPAEFSSRDAAVAWLARFGFGRDVGLWMAANLERAGGRYRWRLDFEALEALLRDFFQADLWEVLDRPPGTAEIHMVRATRSRIIDDAEAARLEAIGRATGRVRVHTVAGGHWLNADNPGGMVALLAHTLP